MNRLIKIKIVIQFVYAIIVIATFSLPFICGFILFASIIFQYVIEYNIIKHVNYSKEAIKLIIVNLLQVNIIPITLFLWLLRNGESFLGWLFSKRYLPLSPIAIINIIFVIYIFIQLQKRKRN